MILHKFLAAELIFMSIKSRKYTHKKARQVMALSKAAQENHIHEIKLCCFGSTFRIITGYGDLHIT
jgi:hypothetical protein